MYLTCTVFDAKVLKTVCDFWYFLTIELIGKTLLCIEQIQKIKCIHNCFLKICS